MLPPQTSNPHAIFIWWQPEALSTTHFAVVSRQDSDLLGKPPITPTSTSWLLSRVMSQGDAQHGGHRARRQPCSGIGLTSFEKQENIALGGLGRAEMRQRVLYGFGGVQKTPCALVTWERCPMCPSILGLQQLFPKSQKASQYPKSQADRALARDLMLSEGKSYRDPKFFRETSAAALTLSYGSAKAFQTLGFLFSFLF